MVKSRWLLKTEPAEYAWADLLRDGAGRWDGVRNHQAAGFLRQMAVEDEALIYHTGTEKSVVGIARISRAAYPDPSDPSGRFVAVDLVPRRPLARPISLAALRADSRCADFLLLHQPRLSVMPVPAAVWKILTT